MVEIDCFTGIAKPASGADRESRFPLSWKADNIPLMDELVACHGCDLLVDVSGLQDGSRAACPRCGHLLTRFRRDATNRVLAYSIAAVILFTLANSFSFLSFSIGGLQSSMTLHRAPGALWDYGMPGLSLMVSAFIIVIPALVLSLLILVSAPLMLGRRAPWTPATARLLFALQHWAMAEVFIISVIVSLVKIAALATVVIGISFWSYVGFSLCLTLALSSLDRYQCWQSIESLEAAG
jgi:paraquat-inducible protein A